MQHVLTILAVADLGRAGEFYSSAFGWKLQVEAPVYLEFEMPGGARFGLYQRHGYARNLGQEVVPPAEGRVTATELYFYSSDPQADADRLVSLGGRLLASLSPRPWGDEVVYLADPDGNVLALARPLPAPTFGG